LSYNKIIHMKITNDYILLRNEINKLFIKYKPSERLKHKDKIIGLKRDADQLEVRIINGILNYSLDYNRVYKDLSEKHLHQFLKDNVGISRFLMNRSISNSVGFNEEMRNETLLDFKKLCEKVWEDFIITKEERDELNEFCRENLIDKTQQFIIEQEVSRKFNEGFDLIKIVEYYFLSENLNDSEIQIILKKEYKKSVELNRIEFITSQLGDELSDELYEHGKSKLIKTLHWSDQYSIYIIVVNNLLTSGFEFEIGYKEGETNSWKIMISKKLFDKSDRTRIIDIITDGICYHINSKSSDMFQLKFFLEMKSNIRFKVDQMY